MNRDLSLWTGLLTGPIVWLANLQIQFVLAPWICALHWKPAAMAVTLTAVLAIIAGGLHSWNQWRQLAQETGAARNDARPPVMALAGVVLNAGFLLVVLAQAIPQFMLAGCE